MKGNKKKSTGICVEAYLITHDWNLSNGGRGHFEVTETDIDKARERFDYIKACIETDYYDFEPKFTPYCEGDMQFSVFEKEGCVENRQDLVMKQITMRI